MCVIWQEKQWQSTDGVFTPPKIILSFSDNLKYEYIGLAESWGGVKQRVIRRGEGWGSMGIGAGMGGVEVKGVTESLLRSQRASLQQPAATKPTPAHGTQWTAHLEGELAIPAPARPRSRKTGRKRASEQIRCDGQGTRPVREEKELGPSLHCPRGWTRRGCWFVGR